MTSIAIPLLLFHPTLLDIPFNPHCFDYVCTTSSLGCSSLSHYLKKEKIQCSCNFQLCTVTAGEFPDETMALRVWCAGVDIPCHTFLLLGVSGVPNSMVDSCFLAVPAGLVFLAVPAGLVDSNPNDCILIEVRLKKIDL